MNWDSYSDQPFVEMDPKKKKKARLRQFDEMSKILFTALFIYPIGYLFGFIKQRAFFNKDIETKNFFGVGVNLDKYPQESSKYIDELGVKNITIRVPLWDTKNIENYYEFAKSFPQCEIVFILMQSRDLVMDKKALEESVRVSFSKLSKISKKFQFGVAINRYKWGYYTTKEYLRNLQLVAKISKDYDIKLLGSSVIDFEYLLSIRTLFNFFQFKLYAVTTLLYVDRRGAPENTQGGLNLLGKIEFLWFLNRLSSKSQKKRLYITETNWPIKDSQPYTPTSNDECVTEDIQSQYLVRYYLLALVSGKVRSVYWHQLFSPGFGLVDFRDGLRKRESFYALKFLIQTINGAKLVDFSLDKEEKYVKFLVQKRDVLILWGHKEISRDDKKYKYYKITGEELKETELLGTSLVYKIEV